MKYIYMAVLSVVIFTSVGVGSVSLKTIYLSEGQSIDLLHEIAWPQDFVCAYFDRPVIIGGTSTVYTTISQESAQMVVSGPVIVTLSIGIPDQSTPDVIGN